jgi:hypothetical protein
MGTDLPRSTAPKGASNRSMQAAALVRLTINISNCDSPYGWLGASAIWEHTGRRLPLSTGLFRALARLGQPPAADAAGRVV